MTILITGICASNIVGVGFFLVSCGKYIVEATPDNERLSSTFLDGIVVVVCRSVAGMMKTISNFKRISVNYCKIIIH